MNKNILYIGIAVVVGLFAGWLIFGTSAIDSKSTDAISSTENVHDHTEGTKSQLWTCSMHPQIMQPEAGDCPICGMELIPAKSSGEGLAVNEVKMTKNAMALANVRTAVVGNEITGNDGVISLSGKITINDEENAIQASYFDGRIEKLNINFVGQEIKKGQLLATIYAPNLVAAQQELITASSLKKSQPSLYKAVRNKLKLWKLSENQIDAIEESGKVRENFPIYATVSGTVSEKMASNGDYVKQGQPIVKVSNLNSVWAEFDAYENQISQFKKGQKLKVETNAYPNKEFDATVSFIDPVLNTQTRTVTIRATLKNKEGVFKPGMFVKGIIQVNAENSNAQMTIPASSVMWTGERSIVYIKTNPNEPVFEMREVTLGNRNGDIFVVVSGLKNGDEIVANGTFTVDAAAQLQGKNSMMNQVTEMETKMTSKMEMKMKLPNVFQKEFASVINSYLDMKDAFVESDATKIATFAEVFLKKFKSMNQSDLSPMVKSHLTQMSDLLTAISENVNLENQRDHFVIFNENMVTMAQNADKLNTLLYVQKCPMANKNKGAVWLSKEKEILNPYYGADMLSCGSVQKILSD